ncbi:NAD(P)H-binding protein [Staphylococcus epidermidis]|nr:NAD(P)H-binding protein [Staphylococcus epidermidis]
MKIAVVAANGKAGQLIVEEGLNRGMDITAIVRGENKTRTNDAIIKDVYDIEKKDIEEFDVIVDAVGGLTPETVNIIPDAANHLAKILQGLEIRLLVVGGAGSLFVNAEHTQTVADVTPFPDEVMPVLNAHQKALNDLREYDDVKWTYISPAADFQADGERTGKYILGGEELILNGQGESVISYADYAIAVIDEIESGSHIKERISVVGE